MNLRTIWLDSKTGFKFALTCFFTVVVFILTYSLVWPKLLFDWIQFRITKKKIVRGQFPLALASYIEWGCVTFTIYLWVGTWWIIHYYA